MVAVADCRFPRCAFLCIGCEVEEVVLEKKKIFLYLLQQNLSGRIPFKTALYKTATFLFPNEWLPYGFLIK